jgi:hypothetical protein
MNVALLAVTAIALTATPAVDNSVFNELRQRGLAASDGTKFKLPAPILADGLDAAGQRAAIGRVCDARNTVEALLQTGIRTPVIVRVRTVKKSEGEGPSVRAIDVWFAAHGDWNTLLSKDFLESASGEKKHNEIVLKSGLLTPKELQKRNLSATTQSGREERFVYTTFVLFERVEVSATRFAVVVKGKESILAAGRLDVRFDRDADYPNRWRPLLRDAQAEISRGPAQTFAHAGGYAKMTRLKEPATAVFVEFHLIYEEPYGWFDGVSLVKQKLPPMVQETVRKFRRKLADASEEKVEKGRKP